MVRVSVVIAFHRTDEYLRLAIDSVLASTEKDIEVLLVADRMQPAVLHGLTKTIYDGRVLVIKSPGAGAGDARNEGFRIARGEYIAILDSDDISYPDRLRIQADYLDKHSDVVAVGSQLEKITSTGEVVGVSDYPKHVRRSFFHKPFDGMIANPSSMIRKTSLEKVGGGYRQQFSKTVEDLDLWNRLLRIGRIVILPEVLIGYRTHELQNTAANADEISWHLGIVQLIDIYETYGNGQYNLEALGKLNPSTVSFLRSNQAQRTLGFRGRVRFAVYHQLSKADEIRKQAQGNFVLSSSPRFMRAIVSELSVLSSGPLAYIVKILHHSRYFSV